MGSGVRQSNLPSILPAQLFARSLDTTYPDSSLLFDSAELIEAMEAEIVVLRRENAVLRAAGDDIRAVLSRATEAVEIAIKTVGGSDEL